MYFLTLPSSVSRRRIGSVDQSGQVKFAPLFTQNLLSSTMYAGISHLCSPMDFKKLAWTKVATLNLGFLPDRKLAWTEMAKLNLGISVCQKACLDQSGQIDFGISAVTLSACQKGISWKIKCSGYNSIIFLVSAIYDI